MKARIDKNGWIEIERAGKFKKHYCPFTPGPDLCGDWCPLFGEPEEKREPMYGGMCTAQGWQAQGEVSAIELSICQRTLRFDKEDFEDQR